MRNNICVADYYAYNSLNTLSFHILLDYFVVNLVSL
jgi:hypothetical protein